MPADFILPVRSSGSAQESQDLAVANCLAQSEALMDGYTAEQALEDLVATGVPHANAREAASQRVHRGNRPSTTILIDALTPTTLGQLIALYEHKVFVEGIIWGINSFDQFGVELGKRLATSLADTVAGTAPYGGQNPSTAAMLELIKQWRRPI